jgi:acyl dehydratase
VTLEQLEGAAYGPVTVRLTADRIAAYVAATTDDADRWVTHAPPSIAGALLFAVAPDFLWSEDVGSLSTVLVHTDQSFQWHGPLPVDAEVAVAAAVSRVRVRGPMNFVTFEATMATNGRTVVDSTSNFLMGADVAGDPPAESEEPPVRLCGIVERPRIGSTDRLAKSASRVDLVRYAAASGDFNPVHYDHDAARAAGLPGVVVHGLLTMAWASQIAASASPRSDPLVEMRARFRAALLPGAQAVVEGARAEDGHLAVSVGAGDARAVVCRVVTRDG